MVAMKDSVEVAAKVELKVLAAAGLTAETAETMVAYVAALWAP